MFLFCQRADRASEKRRVCAVHFGGKQDGPGRQATGVTRHGTKLRSSVERRLRRNVSQDARQRRQGSRRGRITCTVFQSKTTASAAGQVPAITRSNTVDVGLKRRFQFLTRLTFFLQYLRK